MIWQLLRKISEGAPSGVMKFFINIWPPFIGAGIYVKKLSPDFRYALIEMKLRWYNRNYVGTQFGGSLYAMTDPVYMLLIMSNLGRNYIVWDKAAKIDFKKPGRGTVRAEFKLTGEQIAEIKQKADGLNKYIFDLPVNVIGEEGEIIAEVIKTLYVRKKN